VKITFNVKGFFDRRTTPLLEAARVVEQQRADQAVEQEYRRRVRNNWKERARVQGIPRTWLSPAAPSSESAMLQRQAN
jgi:hypothetical protein